MTDLSALDEYERTYADILAGHRPAAPTLGQPYAGLVYSDRVRPTTAGRHEMVSRHYVTVPIHGDHRLLMFWPDGHDTGLVPVDAQVRAELSGVAQPNALQLYQLSTAQDTWIVSAIADGSDEFALFTSVDLSLEQEQQIVDGVSSVEPIFNDRIAVAHRFLDAITAQIAHYFDVEIRHELRERIAAKRTELINRAGVTSSLSFPNTWKVPEPILSTVAPAVQPLTAPRVSEATGTVEVATRPRLAEASFTDVIAIIRIWADAVERYTRAFAPLNEDQISDLLAATLNATLPGAQREVYTRKGKSDIFIHADTLAAGTGPARVFICETKWAHTDAIVTQALDPQLFGYLNTHDTAAVLLLLVPQKRFQAAVDKRMTALRAMPGFVGDTDTTVPWPVLDYELDGRHVRVCVATVHIPRGADSDEPPEQTPNGPAAEPAHLEPAQQ
ncbi:hypothetical protein AB0I30_23140 [Nocardia tengchongensis]|uniref:hypothetical protein n=1 Tax=Nocardia tengchongensis TaxID=2055889 RepID=UPI0033D9741D